MSRAQWSRREGHCKVWELLTKATRQKGSAMIQAWGPTPVNLALWDAQAGILQF